MATSPLLSPLLALAAAVIYGLVAQTTRLGLNFLDPQRGSAISILTTLTCFIAMSPWWFSPSEWMNPGLLAFVVAGLVHPVLSRYCAYESNRRIGATASSTFDATSPLFGAGLAILFLGETLSSGIFVGTLLAMVGVMFIYWAPSTSALVMQAAVLFSFGAAMFRAVGLVAGKFGLNALPNPFMAAFVTFAVSALLAVSLLVIQRNPLIHHLARSGSWWFVVSGVMSAVASVCIYFALLHGRAVVVIPIVSAAPLFTLLAGRVFGLEKLTVRIILGVAITITGVAFVSLSRS